MSLTDPVADFLTRIRNAIKARQQKVDVPASKLKLEIARILKEEGYISNFKATEEEGKKSARVPEVRHRQRVADLRPEARVASRLPRVCRAQRDSARARRTGINILTTPKGVMTGRQARKEGVGGEVLCEIY